MSKTPVETSGDVNVTVASNFWKVPSSATEAFTENLTLLSSCATLKTGACARLGDGSTVDATRHRMANRMKSSLNITLNFAPLMSLPTDGRHIQLPVPSQRNLVIAPPVSNR